MKRLPNPDRTPRRLPGAQLAALPGGGALLRHRRGASVIESPGFGILEAVLERVDGRRDGHEICRLLAEVCEPREVGRALARLEGEAIEFVGESKPDTPRGKVWVLGGDVAATLAERLRAAGFEAEHTEDLGGDSLSGVVCVALEEIETRKLFELQRRLLETGAPGLFLTAEPDGLHLGPVVVPGLSPCLACTRLAALRFLGLPAADLLELAAGFRTERFRAGPKLDAVLGAAVAEVVALLAPEDEGELLSAIHWWPEVGPERLRPLDRAPDCPLCAGLAPAGGDLVERSRRLVVDDLESRPRRARPSTDGAPRSVGILGGGTAGYLAALALRRHRPELEITLIESSAVPIIGVGEATTPLMPQFLHVDLGLDVHEFFREVQPTLKLGIRFEWGESDEGYYFNYPFGKVDVLEPWLYEGDVRGCSLRSLLMSAGRAPIFDKGEIGSALDTRVAYHLDNRRFVAYLERRARERGIGHVDTKIESVELSEDAQEVRALVAEDGRRLCFDLYLDCSGFRSILLERALESPFIDYGASLFTDRAVIATVPHRGQIMPYTTAETMSSGWCWSTPQRDADHRGYVFASAFQSAEDAAVEMREKNPGMGDWREVRFRAGRHEHFIRGNVVALGNSYGFVEPLESTALHMLIRQIGLLVRHFPRHRKERGWGKLLNRQVGDFWDYLAWFLAIHYRFNRRLDTRFWRACREEVDVTRHGELLEIYRERGPLSYDRALAGVFDYPDPLWGAEGVDLILMGQKVPCEPPQPVMSREKWQERRRLTDEVVEKALEQARALELVAQRPELLEDFVGKLRARGPAFS